MSHIVVYLPDSRAIGPFRDAVEAEAWARRVPNSLFEKREEWDHSETNSDHWVTEVEPPNPTDGEVVVRLTRTQAEALWIVASAAADAALGLLRDFPQRREALRAVDSLLRKALHLDASTLGQDRG